MTTVVVDISQLERKDIPGRGCPVTTMGMSQPLLDAMGLWLAIGPSKHWYDPTTEPTVDSAFNLRNCPVVRVVGIDWSFP